MDGQKNFEAPDGRSVAVLPRTQEARASSEASVIGKSLEHDEQIKLRKRIKATPIQGKIWFLIVIIAFAGQVAWCIENNFFNLFIQDAFNATLSDVALLVSASAITATVTTLFVGAWSDRVGRRKIFIGIGTILWGISILIFGELQLISSSLATGIMAAATIGITLTIIMDCVMTFFGSLTNDACFNAWLTDITDDTNRGKVEGINQAMPMLAMLAVFGGANFLLIVRPDGSITYDYQIFFNVIGVLVIIVGILVFILMKDSKPKVDRDSNYFADVVYGFRPTAIRKNKMLYMVLGAFIIFATAMQVFMPYYILYLRLPDVLAENYVYVMAPGVIISAFFTIWYGRRMDQWGFVRSIIPTLIIFLVGTLILAVFADPVMLFIGSMFMYCGYLGTFACLAAEIRNNTPLDHVGLFQGIRIFSIVLIPMLVGPWIGTALVGSEYDPSSMIFLGGAVVGALTFIMVYFISRAKKRRLEDYEHVLEMGGSPDEAGEEVINRHD